MEGDCLGGPNGVMGKMSSPFITNFLEFFNLGIVMHVVAMLAAYCTRFIGSDPLVFERVCGIMARVFCRGCGGWFRFGRVGGGRLFCPFPIRASPIQQVRMGGQVLLRPLWGVRGIGWTMLTPTCIVGCGRVFD